MTTCPRCGGALVPDASGGRCSRCMLEQGLAIVTGALDGEARPEPSGSLREFGDYTLVEEIARGGMGVVHKARQKSLGRIVAVKTLLLGPRAEADIIKRLRGEATVAAGLSHPNIVAIHEVGVHQGEHYLVMDFVEGPNLAQFMKGQALAPRQAARYVKSVAEAIHHAHERGVLHRDLKPSNVLIDAEDRPRVTDFGLASRLDGQSSLTASGRVIGSPAYMPPEQAAAAPHRVGRRSDVYSLGATLYHAITGRPPFTGEGLSQTLEQVLHRDPVSPRLLNPSVPHDLDTICLKCLEKEPSRRYGTARELAAELDRFLRDEPILARPVGVAGKAWRWSRRKPALAGALGLALTLLLVIAAGSPVAAYRINQARERAQRDAYASDMSLAQRVLAANDLGHALALLNQHRPGRGQRDLRGWEWRYLWKQYHLSRDGYSVLHQASNAIASMAVSFDGKLLACGEEVGGRVTLLDLEKGRVVERLVAGVDAAMVAFSPREPLLAMVNSRGMTGFFPPNLESTIHFWDAASRKFITSFPANGRCRRPLSFSPDGRMLLSSQNIPDGNAVRFWRVPDGSLLGKHVMRSGEGNSGPVWPFALSPNQRLLACGAPIRELRVVDWASSEVLWKTNTQDEVVSLAFSPDGKSLAGAAGLGSSTIHLWDAESGRELRRLEGHRGFVSALVFWPDGKTLASASGDHTIRIWNLRDLADAPGDRVLVGHGSEVWNFGAAAGWTNPRQQRQGWSDSSMGHSATPAGGEPHCLAGPFSRLAIHP